jgi:hypothetical protein
MKAHTDLVILDTLVHLVRQVPWGPTRDQLEKVASERRLEAETPAWAGAWDYYNKLAWEADLYTLAAEGRFPRSHDKAIPMMTDEIVDQIRDMQDGRGVIYPYPAHLAIREGVQFSLKRNGFDLQTLSLPPTLEERIDRGDERPAHVSQDRWDKAVAAYNRAMLLENTPAEFIRPEL